MDSPEGTPGRELTQQPHGGAITSPWQKGQSGNPKGRPRGRGTSIERLVMHELKRRGIDGLTERQRGSKLIAEGFGMGDLKMIEVVLKLNRPDDPLVTVNVSANAHTFTSLSDEAQAKVTNVVQSMLAGDGEE